MTTPHTVPMTMASDAFEFVVISDTGCWVGHVGAILRILPAPPTMSNTSGLNVRKVAAADPRVRRSTHALGAALVELMLEQRFENITVQAILNRADVSRSTFYAHFENKSDVLLSSYERMFGWLEIQLDTPSAVGVRVAPVAEFVAHIAESRPLVDALRTAGQMQQMSELGVAYMARIIERRIRACPGSAAPVPPSLIARMLSAALIEMVEWSFEQHASTSPAQMDAVFHALAWTWLRRASYEAVNGHASS